MTDRDMMKALEADGEKLRQLTGEDHGPFDIDAPLAIKPDPRDPDYSREGIFVLHNCVRCNSGKLPCVEGSPSRCEYPRARND